MDDLIRDSLSAYLGGAIFVSFIILMMCLGLSKKIKSIERKRIKIVLRVALILISVGVCLSYFAVCVYPVSLAYYELNNDIISESSSIINSISCDKDHYYLFIDDIKYTCVYSSKEQQPEIMNNIKQGDKVDFKYGKNSKFILEIIKASSE